MSHDREPQMTGVGAPLPAIPEDESWLGRWSRRKRQAGVLSAAGAAPTAGIAEPDGRSEELLADEIAPAIEPEAAVLPAIESLDEHSDYRAFMSEKVSEELRLAALRRLFRLPQFNISDGLNDYDQDFTCFKPLGTTVPQDMLRSLALELKTTRPRAPEGLAVTPADPDAPPVTVADTDKSVEDDEQG